MRGKPKTVEIVLGQSRKLLYNQFAKNFALFLLAAVGGPSFAYRLMFSGICARAQVSEWISSSVLPEPLCKHHADRNGLRKVQLIS